MIAAFVDVDHTLICGNSQMRLAHYFFRKGIIGIRPMIYIALWGIGQFLNFRLINSLTVRKKCYSKLAGKKREMVDGLFLEFYKRMIDKIVYPNARNVISEHQKKNHKIVLVSATIGEVVRLLAEAIGANAYFGTQLEVEDDIYTGRIVGQVVEGEVKASFLREWAKANDVSLEESFAYGNSKEDIPMLLLVGHPIAVNPDTVLTRLAIQNQWTIKKWFF